MATGKAGPAIKVGDEPLCIALTPDGQTAYVGNTYRAKGASRGSVTPIDLATGTAGPAIDVPGQVRDIAINP
ncbi:MAG TPA: hypothetical protein VGH27_22535 [Streptosporangiaceae bacterium]